MTAKILCKKVDFNTQAFYAELAGKKYFLFNRAYSSACREFFKNGYYLTDNVSPRKACGDVKIVLDKIPSQIRYIEKEYGVEMYEKTKRKAIQGLKRSKIKTLNFLTQKQCLECVSDLY